MRKRQPIYVEREDIDEDPKLQFEDAAATDHTPHSVTDSLANRAAEEQYISRSEDCTSTNDV
jgi:hypothetical protein